MYQIELPELPGADAFPLKVSEVMWGERRVDILGQAIIILVGVFGVVVLFKEYMKQKECEK